MKFYTAKYDKVFKTVICSEERPEMLKTFLSYILGIKIENITFLKSELEVNNVKEKNKMVDLLVKTDKEYIHVEMNSQNKDYLQVRNFCYFASIYARKTKTGENYDTVSKFIHIDFTYGKKEDKEIKRIYKVMDEYKKEYINNFEIIEYNMDRIMEFWYNKNKEEIEKYKYLIMLDLKSEELDSISKGDGFVEKYKELVEELNEDETFRSWMTKEEDDRMILNTEKSISFKEGKEEGSIQSKKEIAKNMLQKDIDVSLISEVTELSEEEIQELK